MTKLLSTKKIEEMAEDGAFLGNVYEITAAIEAAALEAQGKQEPVGYVTEKNPRAWDGFYCGLALPPGTKLYAAPVVRPDMVMVPREAFDRLSSTGEECEFNDMAGMCFPLDEWSDFEAMIAAAEVLK